MEVNSETKRRRRTKRTKRTKMRRRKRTKRRRLTVRQRCPRFGGYKMLAPQNPTAVKGAPQLAAHMAHMTHMADVGARSARGTAQHIRAPQKAAWGARGARGGQPAPGGGQPGGTVLGADRGGCTGRLHPGSSGGRIGCPLTGENKGIETGVSSTRSLPRRLWDHLPAAS